MMKQQELYEQQTGRLLKRREPNTEDKVWRVFDGTGTRLPDEPFTEADLAQLKNPQPDYAAEYAAATTTPQKLDVLARAAGLKDREAR